MKEKERKGRDGGSKKEGKGYSVVLYHTQYVCMCTYAPCQGSSPY